MWRPLSSLEWPRSARPTYAPVGSAVSPEHDRSALSPDFTDFPPRDAASISPPRETAAAPAIDRVIEAANNAALERRLTAARLAAAVVLVSAMAVGSDPYHSPAATLLMAAYVAYSAAVFALEWRFALPYGRMPVLFHAIDFSWATAATALSGGTSSHTFLLFVLVIAAAAYRWSLRGSLVTAGGVLIVAIGEAAAAAYGLVTWPFEMDTLVLLPLTVVIFAVLFGLLAQRLHALGAQSIALGQILSRIGQVPNTSAAVYVSLQQILRLFAAREAVLVGHEIDRDRTLMWHARSPRHARLAGTRRELSRDERDRLFFAPGSAARTFEIALACSAGPVSSRLEENTGAVIAESVDAEMDLPHLPRWQRLSIVLAEVPGCWRARLFVIDAARPGDIVLRLALLDRLVQQLTPAFASLYFMRRLRSRAEARERARLGRELHDGVVQTLAVFEMRIEAAARRVKQVDPALAIELGYTRELLRHDMLNLRELIQRVRPIDVDARRLPGELTDVVNRFSRMTGITARLVWTPKVSDLTPRQCEEVVRIVQEALTNARRHSRARNVTVHVRADASNWELAIEDDGVGFGFNGRRTQYELQQRNEGPRVLRERAESLGGSLEIESSGHGSRLEVVFPRA
jgi:signal transduction histidine kinase